MENSKISWLLFLFIIVIIFTFIDRDEGFHEISKKNIDFYVITMSPKDRLKNIAEQTSKINTIKNAINIARQFMRLGFIIVFFFYIHKKRHVWASKSKSFNFKIIRRKNLDIKKRGFWSTLLLSTLRPPKAFNF
jgi:hypothetical protein